MANTAKFAAKTGRGGDWADGKIFGKRGVSSVSNVSPEAHMYSAMRVIAWFTWLRAFHWCRQFGVLSREPSKRYVAIKNTNEA